MPDPCGGSISTRIQHTVGDEETLISGLRQRDPAAITQLYNCYAGAIYGLILRMVKEVTVSEDLLQETFTRIWQNFAYYDATKGRLFTWMARLTRNLVLDHLKSRMVHDRDKNQKIADVVHLVERQTAIEESVDGIGVGDLLKGLREDQRDIIDLIYFQGYTQSEAAQELSIPLGTVKTRVRAAILAIRKEYR